MIKEKKNILFVTQRLSDFVEMKRAASALKQYGYTNILLFCGVGQKIYDDEVISEINNALKAGEIDHKIIKLTFYNRYTSIRVGGRINLINNLEQKIRNLIEKILPKRNRIVTAKVKNKKNTLHLKVKKKKVQIARIEMQKRKIDTLKNIIKESKH